MEPILQELCDRFPQALGAAVCDSEGESLGSALGSAEFPQQSLELIESALPLHYDRASWTEQETKMFALRQWAAEPSRSAGLLRRAYEFAGESHGLDIFSIRSEALDLAVGVMEEHMYLVLVLVRPNLPGLVSRVLNESKWRLEAQFRENS